MADEQVAEAPRGLQLYEEVEDLGLDGEVEGAGRLVADDATSSTAMTNGSRTRSASECCGLPESSTGTATCSAVIALRPVAVMDFGILPEADRQWFEDRGIVITPLVVVNERYPDGGISELQTQVLDRYADRDVWFANVSRARPEAYLPLRFTTFTAAAKDHGPRPPQRVEFACTPQDARAALLHMLADNASIAIASYKETTLRSRCLPPRDLDIAVLATRRSSAPTAPSRGS